MKQIFLGFVLLCIASVAHAQSVYPQTHTVSWQSSVGMQPVPVTQTTVSSSPTYVTAIHLSDPSGSAATVKLYDGSTLVYSVTLGGTNPMVFDLPLLPFGLSFATSVSWQSSVAGVVLGNIAGAY